MVFIPDRGHLIWLTFDPQAGREQAGRRPALILSPATYNQISSLALACPVTRQRKGYPFEVLLPQGISINGVILVDHIKSLDWRARQAELITKLSEDTIREVAEKLRTLLPDFR
jgi:mRNA interferase MazF